MDLSPEELERATFPLVKRGYDPHAVERFLVDIAARLREADDFQRAGEEVAVALRGLHGLLNGMKGDAEDEALRIRTEAEQEAFRVRTAAEQHSVGMHRDAAKQIRELHATAEANADRIRAEAERERDELMAHAQSEVRSMLDEAQTARAEADKLTEAADRTLTARRTELEEYLASVATLAEHTARTRAAAVIEGYAAQVERLQAVRQHTAIALRNASAALADAVSELHDDVDLTEGTTGDGDLGEGSPPTESALVENAVTTALESVASPLEARPGQLL